MKKLILVTLITLFLAGCGSTKNFETSIGTKVIEENLKEMKTISDSTLTDAYNLDLSKMEEHTFKQNQDGDFYAIIKTSKKNDVKKDMENYFKRVKEFNSSYSPERLKILENRTEKELGDYLIYIISKDSDKIYSKILEKLD